MPAKEEPTNTEINQKEQQYNHLTMEIGQLYVKYRNTEAEHLMDMLNEKIEEIRKLESDLSRLNTRQGLE